MKTLSQLLSVLLLLTLPTKVQAQLTFTTNNGSITITGCTGNPTVVIIPSATNGYPVTRIGDRAFLGGVFRSVTIPDSVTDIGTNAFRMCDFLTDVVIGNGVTNIGSYAFGGCYDLTNIVLGNSVANIGSSAFNDCVSLTNIVLGNSVTDIGNYAFSQCSRLSSIAIPGNVLHIGAHVFEICPQLMEVNVAASNPVYSSLDGVLFSNSLATLLFCPEGKWGTYSVPNGVTNIGSYAFFTCDRLTNVVFSDTVKSIGDNAFYDCNGLTNVVFGNSVSDIGIWAFCQCTALASMAIPDSVTNIGRFAFGRCSSMTMITVNEGNPSFSSLDGVLFDHDQTTLWEWPAGRAGSYVIPSSVKSIRQDSFTQTGLTNITIPNSVTNIDTSAFYGCSGISYLTIPDSVTSIGTNAFCQCSGLTSVTMGNGVTSIGYGAFSYCSNLTAAYFAGNCPTIGNNAFYRDNKLTAYYLPGTTNWDLWVSPPPAALWNPVVQATDGNFGVQGNQFGFTVAGTADIPIAVVACTNLGNPTWFPLQTCTLTNGSVYFSDPEWTNYPARLYRIRSP